MVVIRATGMKVSPKYSWVLLKSFSNKLDFVPLNISNGLEFGLEDPFTVNNSLTAVIGNQFPFFVSR